MTEQSIQEARARLTAGEAVRCLETILFAHKRDLAAGKWLPETAAAVEWAIELLTEERDRLNSGEGTPHK